MAGDSLRARVFAANAVTLFGTAFAFVPLGAWFARELPDGLGFPLFLLARLVPGLVLAPLYGRRADATSPRAVLTVTQLLAGLSAVGVLLAVHEGWPLVALAASALSVGFGSTLKALFPGLVRGVASDEAGVRQGLSTWYVVRAAALALATAAGGWLQPVLGLVPFLAIDAATFFIAWLAWLTLPSGALATPLPTPASPRASLEEALGAANVANFFRNVFFGTFGALFPAFVLGAQGGGPEELSSLFAVVGVATVLGAFLARFLVPGLASGLGLMVVELSLVGWALSTSSFKAFLIPVGLACAAVAASEVLLQTAYVGGGAPARANVRGATFQATENLASLTGAAVAVVLAPFHLAPPRQLALAVVFALASMVTLVAGRASLRVSSRPTPSLR